MITFCETMPWREPGHTARGPRVTYGEGKAFTPSHPFAVEALAEQIKLGCDRGAANVLLATAPDHSGRMRPEDVEQLRRLGQFLQEERPVLGKP